MPAFRHILFSDYGDTCFMLPLHAVTATKVDTCQRTCNLAVLVAE